MQDALLTLSLALGLVLQTFLLSSITLPRRRSLILTGVAAVWVLGPWLIELAWVWLRSLWTGEPLQFNMEISGFGLFSFFYVFPFYGFLNPHLLQIINRLAVAMLTLVFWYTVYIVYADYFQERLPFLILGIGCSLITFIALFLKRLPIVFKFFLYAWFLTILLTLVFLELPRIFAIVSAPVDRVPGFIETMMVAVIFLYLAFHTWFAFKYALILLSNIRKRGRELAVPFIHEKVHDDDLPAPVMLLLLALQAGLYGLNEYIQFITPGTLMQLSLIVLPQLIGFWMAWHERKPRTAESY